MRYVIFQIGVHRFGLPLASVQEIAVPTSPIARIPRTPAAFWGLMNLRGKAITVVETSRLLLLDTPSVCADTPQGKVILLERDLHDLGLLVSEVEGIHFQKDMLQFNSVATLDATLLTQKIIDLLQSARSKC